MLDTNIILRYLLNDNAEMASEAERIIRDKDVQVNIEIIAEIVYVLKRRVFGWKERNRGKPA